MKYSLFLVLPALVLFGAGCSDTSGPSVPEQSPFNKGNYSVQSSSNREDVVPNSYIVVFSKELQKDEKASLKNLGLKIAEMKSRHTFEVTHQWGACLRGFAAIMDPQTAAELADEPGVKFVEPDRYVYATRKPGPTVPPQQYPWGIGDIEVAVGPTLPDKDYSGSSVEVYVIDTGIDLNHPDLNVSTTVGINYSSGPSSNFSDGNGHGTHVAGTIGAKDNTSYVVGVAPGVKLFSVRVLNNAGSGTTAGVISGINWVTNRANNNPNSMVANMSLGGGTSQSLDDAVVASKNAGVTYCIAAGNDNLDASTSSPARIGTMGGIITVGAYDANHVKAYFSNFGSAVTILAPGVNILSTYKGSSTATLSGTSMASPHVAGAAAVYLATHTASPAQVESALIANADTDISGFTAWPGSTGPSVSVSGW